MLLPNGVAGPRFAHDAGVDGDRWDPTTFATIAEAIHPF